MGTGSGVDIRKNSIRVTFTHNGEQQRKTLKLEGGQPMPPTPTHVRYAERLVAEIKEKIRIGSYHASDYFPEEGLAVQTRTVGQQLDRWLAAKAVAGSTKKGYESAVRFWKNAPFEDDSDTPLSALLITQLRPTHVRNVLADRSDLSAKTMKNYVGPLREALKWSIEDGVVEKNIVDAVTMPKWQKPIADPFTREESDAIIAAMLKNHPGQAHNLCEFWFWAGLRTSEAFGLRWDSVDLRERTVLIHEVLVRGTEKSTTKTGVTRVVKLNSKAYAAIVRQKEHTYLAGQEVFQDPRYGTRWTDERAFRRSFWAPTLKKLGIRYRRPYTMRHSYAQRMLEENLNPAFCAEQLGHSLEMYLHTYTKKLGEDRKILEMSKLEASLSIEVSKEEKAA